MQPAVINKANGSLVQDGAAADFGLAEHYLRSAQAALQAGNRNEFEAARIMVLVALGFEIDAIKQKPGTR